MHASRPYIKPDETAILAAANALLEDIRQPTCIEGVLILVNCLPTNFKGYDDLLPGWIKKWYVQFGVGVMLQCFCSVLSPF
jgi:hypothetical protein